MTPRPTPGKSPSSSTTTASLTKKATPSSSKAWKESFRNACLQRVHARRRQRGATATTTSRHSITDPLHETATNPFSSSSSSSARHMIEVEMRRQGVALSTPCNKDFDLFDDNANDDDPMTISPYSVQPRVLEATMNHHEDEEDSSRRHSRVHHYITEEELFELLDEMEEEMKRYDALRDEELLELAEHEEMDLQEQIADYEQWAQQEQEAALQQQQQQNTPFVMCPICMETNLVTEGNGDRIVCPNHMDGSCALDLHVTASPTIPPGASHSPPELLLTHLLQWLGQVHEHHATVGNSSCHHFLSFEVPGNQNLVAYCPVCGTNCAFL